MVDPKVRINQELKDEMVEEVKDNPEYSSQKAFVNKAVRQLLDNESQELSEAQRHAIKEFVETLED